jgi:hypothetical protein
LAGPGFGTPALGAIVVIAAETVGSGLGTEVNICTEALRRCFGLLPVGFDWRVITSSSDRLDVNSCSVASVAVGVMSLLWG